MITEEEKGYLKELRKKQLAFQQQLGALIFNYHIQEKAILDEMGKISSEVLRYISYLRGKYQIPENIEFDFSILDFRKLESIK